MGNSQLPQWLCLKSLRLSEHPRQVPLLSELGTRQPVQPPIAPPYKKALEKKNIANLPFTTIFAIFINLLFIYLYSFVTLFYGFLVSFEIGLIWGRVSLDLKSCSKIGVFSYGCLSFVTLGKLLWSCTGLYYLHACYFN